MQILAYDSGMGSLDQFINNRLIEGRAYFTREEAQLKLGVTDSSLSAALGRQIHKNQLVAPRQGFYLILRPEDQITGPDPSRWINPLMKFLRTDYRISLLRAAMFHGASHQAAMTFQVVAPQQLRPIFIGRHRIEFIYQSSLSFSKVNQSPWLESLKSDAGYAQVAGVELTLLDCIRYFHKSGGINNVAQIVQDIGGKANSKRLADLAAFYENSNVRRLGYLLEITGHQRQARALYPFIQRAKSFSALDPSVAPMENLTADETTRSVDWLLTINEPIEVDF